MANVSISEQMGAMAIVDELRHRQLVVQEHLNLPARRDEVAKRIRDYYLSKGIVYDDALVEQGVREYFSKRLTHEAAPLTRLDSLIARLLINRKAWGRRVAIGGVTSVLAITFSMALLTAGSTLYNNYKVSTTQSVAVAAKDGTAELLAEAYRQERSLALIHNTHARIDYPAGDRIRERITRGHEEARNLLSVEIPTEVTAENVSAVGETLGRYSNIFDAAKTILGQSKADLDALESLFSFNAMMLAYRLSPAFQDAVADHPTLRLSAITAEKAIKNGDTLQIDFVAAVVGDVRDTYDQISLITPLVYRRDALLEQFKALGLSSEDFAKVTAMSEWIDVAIKELNAERVESSIVSFAKLYNYAKSEVSIDVTDQIGVKSVVERTYDRSGGKSWYLIAHATNRGGAIIPVQVVDSEDGSRVMAEVFGVRVSEDEYRRTYRDKEQDGHVDDRHLGTKRANSLTIEFNQRTSAAPDMILNW